MPLILALDCSVRWINLGLGDENEVLEEEAMPVSRGQAEVLPLAVKSILARHRFDFSDIGRIAVTAGPGYYTGIRVGLAYATALAESLGVRVAPMTSLYAMALPLLAGGFWAAPVIRAGRGAVFSAVYRSAGSPAEIFCPACPACLLRPACRTLPAFVEDLEKLDIPDGKLLIAGDDALLFDEFGKLGKLGKLYKQDKHGYRIITDARPGGAAMIAAARSIAPVDPTEVKALYLKNPT